MVDPVLVMSYRMLGLTLVTAFSDDLTPYSILHASKRHCDLKFSLHG